MSNDIFISYSRRDSEFVARLASDLDAQVAGVWFDQSDIQLGERRRKRLCRTISWLRATTFNGPSCTASQVRNA